MKNQDLTKQYDVAILGGGPSGLTAGIYTSRAFLDTILFAGDPPGGQLMWTTEVENYPGFSNGITGPELIEEMTKQAKKFGTTVFQDNVVKIEGTVIEGFIIHTQQQKVYKAKTVIIATGASAKWLNLESEQRLRSKGVSACATCDGFFFKDKVVGVVGGGDAAMEEATFLTKFATKVYVFVRGSKQDMRASKIMQDKAFKNKKVEFMFNTEVAEVLGDQKVSGVKLFNNDTNQNTSLELQGLFIAIGHKPNTDFLNGLIEVDHVGYAVAQKNSTNSSVEGIFIAGDVHDHNYRQAITAAGFGCMAAIDVEKYLNEDSAL